jgi:very-short-patch-repair endonuclease
MILSHYIIEYRGQPGGAGKQHTWKIYNKDINDVKAKIRLDEAVKSKTPGLIPTQQPQYQSSGSTDEAFTWNGLQLRSPAEQKIAEELEKRQILFFANSRCRITTRIGITETKEADFLIYYKGNSRILEVDGQEYHQSAAKDHQRDRLFERNGISCTRFTANECLNDPANVIDEFLELFDVTQFPAEVYKNESIKTGVSAEEKTTTIDINVNQKTAPSPRPVKIVPDPDVIPF